MAAMDQYYSELSLIENVIHNWDPVKKTIIVIFLSQLISFIDNLFRSGCYYSLFAGNISYNQV